MSRNTSTLPGPNVVGRHAEQLLEERPRVVGQSALGGDMDQRPEEHQAADGRGHPDPEAAAPQPQPADGQALVAPELERPLRLLPHEDGRAAGHAQQQRRHRPHPHAGRRQRQPQQEAQHAQHPGQDAALAQHQPQQHLVAARLALRRHGAVRRGARLQDEALLEVAVHEGAQRQAQRHQRHHPVDERARPAA